jgi:hypothetical protein
MSASSGKKTAPHYAPTAQKTHPTPAGFCRLPAWPVGFTPGDAAFLTRNQQRAAGLPLRGCFRYTLAPDAEIAQLVEQRIRNRISDAMMPGLEGKQYKAFGPPAV